VRAAIGDNRVEGRHGVGWDKEPTAIKEMSMSLTINTNTDAIVAHNNLVNTDQAMSNAMADLSSGLRINTAADDAAGYAISEDLTGQTNGLMQATQNAQDAVSMVQTADGTLNDVEQMLQRIRELAVEYGNGTNDSQDKAAIQSEVDQLTSEISRVGSTAQFNGITLFASATSITFQIGANDGDTISITTATMSSMVGTVSLGGASTLSTIDSYINAVSAQAATFGAVQNRLSYTLDNLATYSENLTAAQSSIQDVDMASEETTFTKEQILEQAGVSMLAQANSDPQMILKLLQ
jgi:flagellin